jgi:hypothetical protein
LTAAHNRYAGEGGIRRCEKRVRRRRAPDYHVEVWSAYIRIGGHQRETSYSIPKHGSRQARAMAERWLTQQRREKRALRRMYEKEQR